MLSNLMEDLMRSAQFSVLVKFKSYSHEMKK